MEERFEVGDVCTLLDGEGSVRHVLVLEQGVSIVRGGCRTGTRVLVLAGRLLTREAGAVVVIGHLAKRLVPIGKGSLLCSSR